MSLKIGRASGIQAAWPQSMARLYGGCWVREPRGWVAVQFRLPSPGSWSTCAVGASSVNPEGVGLVGPRLTGLGPRPTYKNCSSPAEMTE